MRKKRILFVFATIFLLVCGTGVFAETNEILINEFVVDPQTDWGGGGVVSASDEWIEFHNPSGSSKIIDGWNLTMIDTDSVTQTLSGTIPAGGYLVLLNPLGQQSNDGRIELYDPSHTLVDSVSYGDYNDGDVSDNAAEGNSDSSFNECLTRFPNGANTDVDADDFTQTLCTYQSANNFSFIPVMIIDLPVQPSCVLANNNVTISADISGSIAEVALSLTHGSFSDTIILNGTQNGIYSYVFPAEDLIAGEAVQWQFQVTDVTGNTTYGNEDFVYVNFFTELSVSPSEPNGLNGWYISEPVFDLMNSDTPDVHYRWNGFSFDYSGPFGLEGTPNNGNVTGGTQVLFYSSDLCDEPEQEFVGTFDFKDPDIEELTPEPDSTVFGSAPILIRASLDEVYQGNSGINRSSVIVRVDGVVVDADVDAVGAVDAEMTYLADISSGPHEVDLYVEDNAGRSSQTSWSFALVQTGSFDIFVHAPHADIYPTKRVAFNITLSQEADELLYINQQDLHPAYKLLCQHCVDFGNDRTRFKSLNEGLNDLTFRAIRDGHAVERNVSLLVDSKDPKITETLPKSGFTSGLFEINFEEENPETLLVIYGNDFLGFQNTAVNISQDCLKNGAYHCQTQVDLFDYDGTEIEYSVFLEDIAGNTDESNTRKLNVDFSVPQIDSFDFTVDGKFATFTIGVSEAFLDEITYLDFSDANPREKRLCKSLQNDMCEKSISFHDGPHNVTIFVRDQAGNSAEAFAQFFTDSKVPKIKSTLPDRGFATDMFSAIIEEANPDELFLTYGTPDDQRNVLLDVNDCVPDKKNLICSQLVNLSDFEGETIMYLFNLTDVVGNFAVSHEKQLRVDTLAPRVLGFNYTLVGDRKVRFFTELDEPNFEKVAYLDRSLSNPRFITLCTQLIDGACDKTVRFRAGDHLIDIVAYDEAGNEQIIADHLPLSFL